MTRDDFECVVEDMLFHTRGMSRREQAGAVVNSVLWPELVKAMRERDEARAELEKFKKIAEHRNAAHRAVLLRDIEAALNGNLGPIRNRRDLMLSPPVEWVSSDVAAEIDRRGAAIEKLEAELATFIASNAQLTDEVIALRRERDEARAAIATARQDAIDELVAAIIALKDRTP